ncbi:glycosyltransferase [Histophilus somni]|uniref:glycosyltransferase n=1 Tax=Histophilus somni TaxID=731 RepID=UPI002D7ED2D1|nr:glycosyltransferase [Histophilus somni]
MNVVEWEKCHVFEKSLQWIEYCKRNNIEFLYQDQDILNAIFANNVKYLDLRYNFTANALNRLKRVSKKERNQYEEATMPLAIIHYVGPKKSWHEKCSMLKANLFCHLFQQLENPPKEWKIENVPFIRKLKRFAKDLRHKIIYKIY